MIDATETMTNDAISWWYLRRTWDSLLPTPRSQPACRIEDAVYSSSRWSLPAFRALVEGAESADERLDVVEAFFEFLPWDRDTDGGVRAWLEGVARDEPELRDMIDTLASRL